VRRVPVILAAAFASCLFATSALADGPRLLRGGDAKFPHQSFVLSLPAGASASATDVRVFENGESVHELSVESAGTAGENELGSVLVIDASNSMRGAPINEALAAARAFASHRRPAQKLGVVVFNRSTRALLEPTTDGAAIDDALSSPPPLAQETHLRDGAMAGLEMLERAGIRVGSVIVLSDGADTGSRVSDAAVAQAAAERGVRVFTVGLESRKFNEGTLAELAQGTGGEYTGAPSSRDLAEIYDELGAKLAREYLLQYSSVAGPGKRVHVEAAVSGVPGTATFSYKSPKIAGPTIPPTEPKANGLWGSSAMMVLVGFGISFLICFALARILLARHRPETAEDRVAAFAAMGGDASATDEREEERNGLYDRVEQALGGQAFWRRFALDVEIAELKQKPAQIAVATLALTLLVMWLLVKISGAGWIIVFAFLIPWGVRKFVSHRAAKQRLLFGEQLADNLQVIASAMRAGQSFAGAMAVAVEDAPQPARREFERVIADEQLGVPLEDSLRNVVERMDNRDLLQVALVAALQREAGGNSAEVLDRVADTIRDRVSLRRLISTLTAQGRMSRWVVSFVPVGLILFISMANPGYLDPLFHTTLGTILLVISGLMMVAGSFAMKKIAQIEV
jgi:tight adherence protein B